MSRTPSIPSALSEANVVEGWTVDIDTVYDGLLADPVTGEALPGTRGIVCEVTLRRGEETLHARWHPDSRALVGAPSGWTSHMVGRLERHLIARGR